MLKILLACVIYYTSSTVPHQSRCLVFHTQDLLDDALFGLQQDNRRIVPRIQATTIPDLQPLASGRYLRGIRRVCHGANVGWDKEASATHLLLYGTHYPRVNPSCASLSGGIGHPSASCHSSWCHISCL